VSTESRVSNLLLNISVHILLVPFVLQQHVYERTNYIHLELHYTGLTNGLCLYCCTVHLVDSLNITLPTNALIVCHLF